MRAESRVLPVAAPAMSRCVRIDPSNVVNDDGSGVLVYDIAVSDALPPELDEAEEIEAPEIRQDEDGTWRFSVQVPPFGDDASSSVVTCP